MKILKYGLLVSSMYFFSGCVGQPSIAKLDDAEAFKYEKSYQNQYEQIKTEMAKYKASYQWVQPKNKNEACKIYSIGDKSSKPGYELFWDGECKDGYAYGLGREIENSLYNSNETIAFFQNGKAVEYCSQYDKLKGQTVDGECSYGYEKSNLFVITNINEKNGDINIEYQFGSNGSVSTPKMFMITSPFSDITRYFKSYPNFTYAVDDTSKERSISKLMFYIYNERKMHNGYEIMVKNDNQHIAFEMNNNRRTRFVDLSNEYIKSRYAILDEVRNNATLAMDAQQKALFIKEKYKNVICKESVKVDFMDNKEYKAICEEDKKISELKSKIDAKLARLGREKELQLAQENEQRLIQAREAEAAAAQRRAAAAEEANNQAAWDSVNRSIQNMNTNMQMQQLNNNLMMYNFMPKRYDVYLH